MNIGHYLAKGPLSSTPRLGLFLSDGSVVDPNLVMRRLFKKQGFYNPEQRADHFLPGLLSTLLDKVNEPLKKLEEAMSHYEDFLKRGESEGLKMDSPTLSKPLDQIKTYRDFYAHEGHVKKGFEKRKEQVPKAWYEIPAYYKGTTTGFQGPNDEILWPSYSDKLDFELELALVVGRDGKNIQESKARDHFLGFTILNDISARDIQKKEMSIRLGPAKGKDFCSVIGPVIVTMDEFPKDKINLEMTATINGEQWSKGQSGDAHYTFEEMLAFASQEEWILAGDLLGSGTVTTGCGLELDRWIQPGDLIELEVESIGTLQNKVGQKNGR